MRVLITYARKINHPHKVANLGRLTSHNDVQIARKNIFGKRFLNDLSDRVTIYMFECKNKK